MNTANRTEPEPRSDTCEGCNTEMCWCKPGSFVNGRCGGACHTTAFAAPDCHESFTLAQGDNVIGFACELGTEHSGDCRRSITINGVAAEMSWRIAK